MMTAYPVILSILLVISVTVVAVWRMRALPDSISAFVYVFKHKWIWTVWMWAVSLLTLIPAVDRLSNIGMELLGFGSLVCLMFCGAMPLIDKDNTVGHWVFGVSGCVLSQCCVWFINYHWLSFWMLFVFLFLSSYVQSEGWLGRIMKGKGVLVAECVCYISIAGSLLT